MATPAALRTAEEHGVNVLALVMRHRSGDYGDTCRADQAENRRALKTGARLLSVYGEGPSKLWVITEAATDACPACHGYPGHTCEPELGEWLDGTHYRTDRPPRRLTTTVMRPEDY